MKGNQDIDGNDNYTYCIVCLEYIDSVVSCE